MSVDRTDYLMFGIKVDPGLVDHDKHEPMMAGAPGAAFDLVYDGMGGKYAVAGKIIAQSGDYDGMVFTEITDDLLPNDPQGLAATIAGSFNIEVDKLRLYLFSHYS